MKTIIIYMTAAMLLLAQGVKAQNTDSSEAKKPLVIDGKKIRITIDTKTKDNQTKETKIIEGDDTIIIDAEERIDHIDEADQDAMEKEDMIVEEEKIIEDEDGRKKVIKKHTKVVRIDDCDDKKNDRNPAEWFNFDLGFNFLANNGSLDMPEKYKDLELENGKGCNFNLRIYEQSIGLVPNHLYLMYGVGLDWNNYRFRNSVDLFKDSSALTYVINPNIDYKKNKLVSTYVTIPVLLKIKFNEDKKGNAFSMAFGPQFGYLINSHTKQKWEKDGDHKQKTRGDFNLEEFRMGYGLYIGYDNVNLYARYYPNSAFKSEQGPDVNTVSLGLAFGGF